MRIAIDARLNAYRHGGIPQYTRQLLTALAEVAPEEEFISLQHRDHLRPLAIATNVVRRTALTPPHHRFEQWTLPLELLMARPTVLHSPDFIAPLRRPCPAVVTIHDLAFMHFPEILDAAASAYYGQVKTNAPRADAVIAVSEATRQDIAQFLDIPIEQIDVIHEAAAPLYQPLDLRPGEARVLGATPVAAESFMLFVSTLEPRKNLPTPLQALRICLDRRPDAGYRLVVAGRRGWRDEAIFEAVRDLRLGDYVLFASEAGQYDLRWLYNACRLYINPSLYEGFGLPLLEAMACGAACLAAATSSLPEIGGDAAIYVPPLDAGQWADEIEALWDDSDRQAELGRRGIARARQFSWLRAARETLKVYRRAVEGGVPQAHPAPLAPPSEPARREHATAAAVNGTVGLDAVAPGEARPCPRCGAVMLAGEVQRGVLFHAPDVSDDGMALSPRAFACPSCGHVELVVEWPASRPAAARPADLAVDEAPAVAAGLASEPPLEELSDPALADGIAAIEAETDLAGAPRLDEIAPADVGALEQAADTTLAADPNPVEAAAPEPEDARVVDAGVVGAPSPGEPRPEGSTRASDAIPQERAADADLPPAAEESSDAPAAPLVEPMSLALENGAAASEGLSPNGRLLSPLADSPEPTEAAHAANGARAAVKKSRARQDQSSADAGAPAKRRQSRSKRKQSS